MDNNDRVPKAYDVVCLKKDEEKPVYHAYMYHGEIPNEILDNGKYYDYGEDGILILGADGLMLVPPDDLCDFAQITSANMYDRCLSADLKPHEWCEWEEPDGRTVRVTRLESLPNITKEDTLQYSDLSYVQRSKIKIYGKPMFGEGDVIPGNKCFRPNLINEMNAMWSRNISSIVGVEIGIKILRSIYDCDGDGEWHHEMSIYAPSVDKLNAALNALGVMENDKVKTFYSVGEGEAVKRVVANVSLHSAVPD